MPNNILVKGFLGAGTHCGIKENGGNDLSLIFSTVKATSIGVFTKNIFKAAPVELDIERLKSGFAQAIITNSGNANAATGERGMRDAKEMSSAVARKLKIDDELVLVASTGIIGKPLPITKIKTGANKIVPLLNSMGIPKAQEAMMTTDKFPKISHSKGIIGGKEVNLCTIAKGAGMIHPNMATLLSYTLTDVSIDSSLLKKVFRSVVDKTLNAISVDGCMSTNDTAIIMANSCAENKQIKGAGASLSVFQNMLSNSLSEVAQMIVADGEGATKIIEIIVSNAQSSADAKIVAESIGNSNLVKTAFYGCDSNLGRIVGAIGASGAKFIPTEVSIKLEHLKIFANGISIVNNQKELAEIMKLKKIQVAVSLGKKSKHTWRILASDLTHDYVTINAHYHT
ncbi:MAG: bifunctional glutamate N-acetyltransferase/amino-acid acetyltransferase ArgJ [Deltaproteobacteria bacterium]